jgi:hypothetical protein
LGLLEYQVEFDMGWPGMLPLHGFALRNIPYAQMGREVQRLMAQTRELMILEDYEAYLRSLIVSFPLILLKLFSLLTSLTLDWPAKEQESNKIKFK